MSGTVYYEQMSQRVFGALAPELVRLGWSVFPQELSGRRPGRQDGETIKWQADHDLENRRPTEAALKIWCKENPQHNVAAVMGPGSGGLFCVDIDVLDAEMSAAIEALAIEMLGPTPFRRQGRKPKMALFYRADGVMPASVSRRFATVVDGRAVPSEHAIEILGSGKAVTIIGRHHTTGLNFTWFESHPVFFGPDHAPAVSRDAVEALLEEVNRRWPFIGNTLSGGGDAGGVLDNLEFVENAEGKVCDGREAYMMHLAWRHVVMTAAGDVLQTGPQGEAMVRALKSRLARAVMVDFGNGAVMTGRWQANSATREALSKVSRLVDRLLSGDIVPNRPTTVPQPQRSVPSATVGGRTRLASPAAGAPRRGGLSMGVGETTQAGSDAAPEILPGQMSLHDPEFDFLPEQRKALASVTRRESGGASLEIPQDRSDITGEVARRLSGALDRFFDERVYGPGPDENRASVSILLAPTGAGKTSQTIRRIAEDPRTYRDMEYVDEQGERRTGRMPIVMLLPTYNNIAELRTNAAFLGLDETMGDRGLRQAAAELGVIPESELDLRLADIRRIAASCRKPEGLPELQTMVYAGKIRAGCRVPNLVGMAMAANIGTSGFCQSQTKNDAGEVVEMRCVHYEDCPAITQRADIAHAHIVFMPHSFLSLSIPEELENVRAVIADERIHHLFLHSAVFPSLTLSIPRRQPRLTKREKETGATDVQQLLSDRERVGEIVLDAMRTGHCPAEALLDFEDPLDHRPGLGPTLLAAALRVCSGALTKEVRLVPNMAEDEVRQLCDQPSGRDLREEQQFWVVLSDRLKAVQADRLREHAVLDRSERLSRLLERGVDPRVDIERDRLEAELWRFRELPTRAHGQRDARLQLLWEGEPGRTTEVIRVSWRSTPNWLTAPTLLLDASAQPAIIGKIWNLPPERVFCHEVLADYGAALAVRIVGVVNRTYSTSSVAGSKTATRQERVDAAVVLAQVRDAVSTVCALYGDGRVVGGTSIRLRHLINDGWLPPENIDWCHFGAMRGLDMFKLHTAAISVGRMEVPVRVIDGIAAALTYDDHSPEAPFDSNGTGTTDDGQPLRLPMVPQRTRLRSGDEVSIDVPTFPGRWGRILQQQYREEELSQFVGRLRPVYREGRLPVWFALSSVIPPGLVVDELVSLDDLTRENGRLWNAVRLCGGVAEPHALAAVCPELFDDAEAAALAMRKAGLDPAGTRPTRRQGRGFAAVRMREASEPEDSSRTAYIVATPGEASTRVEAVMDEVFGGRYVIETLWEPPVIGATSRAPDAIELELGTREERGRVAQLRQAEIGLMLMDGPKSDERMGTELFTVEGRALSVAVLSAERAIERYWSVAAA